MATVTKDLGIATAYGYAKSKGYTGTEDEFAQAMLGMTTAVDDAQQYAQDAEDAKDDAQASAESIEQSAAQIAANTSDIADLKEDLGDMSTNGIVPTSRQLLSDKYAVDEEPYKYRASYSGDRMDDEIVGGSIVWNQLVNSASVTLQSGHKYISKIGTAWTVETSTGTAITGLTSGSDMITDLTTMFGTEVADYIYNLEQAEAGAGVAWFKNLFPNDYYEYSEPTLKHVEGLQKHEMVGFNLFDRSQASENKALIWATGIETTEAGSITSPYIRAIGGKGYYANYRAGWLIYDAELNYIGTYNTVLGWNKTSGSALNGVTLPNDAVYLRLALRASMNSNIDMTKVSDICINLSDPSRNGTYEPYVKHSYPLDSSLTLRGIPKIDASGNLYYDGDTYESNGTVTRRYGIVDLGTLTWTTTNTLGIFRTPVLPGMAQPNAGETPDALCNRYSIVKTVVNITAETVPDKTLMVGRPGVNYIYIHDDAYTDAAAFKTAMAGSQLVYEIATPTTETAQSYTALQTVDASGTEEYVSTSIVPVGHYTKYYDDLRKKLDGLPWDLSMIAPIETGTTASQAYVVGKYFILDNQLCKAKTAIASGATFTLNTNYEVTTVADELYTALHA